MLRVVALGGQLAGLLNCNLTMSAGRKAASLCTLLRPRCTYAMPSVLILPPLQVICGMEVAELDGCPRMGPTFGALLFSNNIAPNKACTHTCQTWASQGSQPLVCTCTGCLSPPAHNLVRCASH